MHSEEFMRFVMKRMYRSLALVFVVVSPPAHSAEQEPRCAPIDVSPVIADSADYLAVETDRDSNQKFSQYIQWLASLKVPDAVFVVDFIDRHVKTIEALSLIHHEKVELREWLRRGHRFEDIMTVDYYRAHYDRVYPIAHRRAMIAEMDLLRYYAEKVGFPHIPEIAFGLVTPMVEQRNTLVKDIARRLRFNPEYLDQQSSVERAQFERAAAVFTEGGYRYRDAAGLINQAMELISPWDCEALSVSR